MTDVILLGMTIIFGMTANFMYLHYRLDKFAAYVEEQQKLRDNGSEIQQKRTMVDTIR